MENRENSYFESANKLKDYKVINRVGEDLGNIKDIMIDLKNDRIAYAVLSFGGFLGMGNKLFVVPWRALELKLYEHTLTITLNVDKEILKKADGFDEDQLPLTYEELFRVYTYYGYQPYWQTGGLNQTGLLKETEADRLDRIERERLRQAETPDRRI
jgi:sporulation protein YlmC with PRC-barrel domain